MILAYLDCPTGASGDMLLGALVDAGVPVAKLIEGLSALPIQGYELRADRVHKNGLGASQVEVLIHDEVTERNLAEITAIISHSRLAASIQRRALDILLRIGEVEARIHGVEIDQVHLHELGGLDTIIDVVGVLLGLEALGIEKLYASPLPLGRGFTRSAHGKIPLPAPATLALLEGIPVVGNAIEAELVTPTGAALLAGLVQEFGNIPPMRLLRTGYGAGQRDLPVPNVLRLLLGEVAPICTSTPGVKIETLACLECNIDNMNPEIFSYLHERLFAAGALDVSFIPIQMKKNRPGTLVNVLCSETQADPLLDIIFYETTTLGARRYSVSRYLLERNICEVDTGFGPIKVKYSQRSGAIYQFAPEYEDCRLLARQHGVPLHVIYRAALRAAEGKLGHRLLKAAGN
jgi:hypothetical protein